MARKRKPFNQQADKKSPSKRATSHPMGEVRIIGGDWRGRKLPVLTAEGLRPTSDRVKETLFNWLQFAVPGARCLDVFSGSGSLGLEALSRGAKQVIFLEKDSQVASQLSQNLRNLTCHQAQVKVTDSLRYLQQSPDMPFDIFFIDPPFNQGLMQPTIDLLFAHHFVKNKLTPQGGIKAWCYLEQEKNLDWPTMPDNWVCHREKTTSNVKYGLFTQLDETR